LFRLSTHVFAATNPDVSAMRFADIPHVEQRSSVWFGVLSHFLSLTSHTLNEHSVCAFVSATISCRWHPTRPCRGAPPIAAHSRAGVRQWGTPRAWAGRGSVAGAARGGGAHRTRSSGPPGRLTWRSQGRARPLDAGGRGGYQQIMWGI